MSTTNEIWVRGERLHLDDQTQLLPSFQANDRTKPDSIQSDYSPEFSVPGNAHNHRLLRHAAASQPVPGAAYVRVPAVLTSGGVETLPLALLYLKGYRDGRYQLQLFGGNRRLIEVLKRPDGTDKMLSDLDLGRFDHLWTPANILSRLPFAHWQAQGYGYSLFDRGKPVDLQKVDPSTLYPSVAAWLVWQQILTDAGFTADSLLDEQLFAALEVPTANPYTFPQDFRDARALQAGFEYYPAGSIHPGVYHDDEFPPERLPFEFTSEIPYRSPTAGATYTGHHTYTADTLGYYNLSAPVVVHYGCRGDFYGQVSCKVMLYVNGQPVFSNGQQIGVDEHRITNNNETDNGGGYMTRTFTPKLERYLLAPTDIVEVFWQGDNWRTGPFNANPTDPYWEIGTWGTEVLLPNGNMLNTQSTFTVTLLEEFPPGGLIHLQDWLPQMKQLDFVKSMMVLFSLTITCDDYRPHLHLATGNRLLENTPRARDWSSKLDLFSQPGRLPERDLAFRFGDYGQRNLLQWKDDENVTDGYGDGEILVADETLAAEYVLATLPFAATEVSPSVAGLLRILNYKRSDITVQPVTYSNVDAQPRLTLRRDAPTITGQLIMVPEYRDGQGVLIPAVLQPFTTTAGYFDGIDLSLLLNKTVLSVYWTDLKAMLEEARYLTERFRLSAADITALDYSVPVWVNAFQEYFCVSVISEFDARRSTEVQLVRLNAKHLPPPMLPGGNQEFYPLEYYTPEFY